MTTHNVAFSNIVRHANYPLVLRITSVEAEDVALGEELGADLSVDFGTFDENQEVVASELVQVCPASPVYARFVETNEGVKFAHLEFSLSVAEVLAAVKHNGLDEATPFCIPKNTNLIAVVEPQSGGVRRYAEKDKALTGDIRGFFETARGETLPTILSVYRSYLKDFIPTDALVVLRESTKDKARSQYYGLLVG